MLTGSGAPLLFVALLLVTVTSLLFHVVVSRGLRPSSYGALGPLLGILLILAVPSSALQVTITKEVAASRARRDTGEPDHLVVGPLLAQAVVVGVALCLAFAAMAPMLRSFFHLPSVAPALMLSAYIVPAAIELVPKAVLLGELQFRRVAVALLVGALARLVLAAAFVHRGDGVTEAMAATVLGEVVTAVLLLPGVRPFIRPRHDGSRELRLGWVAAIPAIVAFGGFWLLNTIDTILSRHYLPPVTSGFYVAASTAAGAVMFVPGTVSTIAFPRFAENHANGPKARTALMQALAAVIVLSAGASVGVIIFRTLIIHLFFGSAYDPAIGIVGILVVPAACISVVNILMHFHISRGNLVGSTLSWLGVLVAGAGIVLFHSSPRMIALMVLIGAALVVATMLLLALRRGGDDPSPASFVGRELWDLREPDLDITIVVPYYNPGDKLRANIQGILDVLGTSGSTYEVVAVSDGSTDGSEKSLEGFDDPALHRILLPRNSGKGEALRVGLAMGRGRYLGFIDADGDLAPDLLTRFVELIRLYEPDVILGSKRHPMSEVEYPRIRRVYSWGYQQLTRALFRLNVRDTQVGLKLVRRDVLAQVLPRMVEKRFAFDLELLVVARHLGYNRFFEAPVKLQHQFTSTISAGSVRTMLMDTLAIFYRLRLIRFYDKPHSLVVSPPAAALPADLGQSEAFSWPGRS